MTEKDQQFVNSISSLLPIVSSFLKPERDGEKELETSFGTKV